MLATMAAPAREALVQKLGLVPHPEGGFFRETWRSGAAPMASRGATDPAGGTVPTPRRLGGARNSLTSIYYMITKEHPHQWWVRNESDHVHYHHAGGTLVYGVAHPDGRYEELRLGLGADDQPQIVVPGGAYKCARLVGGADYALIGEGVGPGFDHRDFGFVTKAMLAKWPEALAAAGDLVREEPAEDFESFYDKEETEPAA